LAPGRRGTATAAHHCWRGHRAQRDHPQRFAGCPVRAIDQPLPRLRARLRVLLRTAQPRLPRPVPRPGFRDPPVCKTRRGGTAAQGTVPPRLSLQPDRTGHQYRWLPAGGTRTAGDSGTAGGTARDPPPGQHRDQVGAGRAGSGSALGDGEGGPGARGSVGHHAGPKPRWTEASHDGWSPAPPHPSGASRPCGV